MGSFTKVLMVLVSLGIIGGGAWYMNKRGQCAHIVSYVPATTGTFGQSEHYALVHMGQYSFTSYKTYDEAMSACMSE
jgi:hypothetical protein